MKQFDLVGIGVGPFNLSLAALLSNVDAIKAVFFDKNKEFSWHPGMMLPEATIQVSHLYDLVTLADPTNKFSFLSYLFEERRLYRFANANFPRVLRREFSNYYAWASRKLENVNFDEKVENINYQDNQFIIETNIQVVVAKHIAVGVGLIPYIPEFAKPYLNDNIYHCTAFQFHPQTWSGKQILVVGGGQSGAEVVQKILSDDMNLPAEITWVSRRNSFLPMDESSFAYEIYTPEHTTSFYQLNTQKKQQLLKDHLLSSDGISPELLDDIYRRIYQLEYVNASDIKIKLFPKHSVNAIYRDGNLVELSNHHTNVSVLINADIIIFCTGYQWQYPEFMKSLEGKIDFDDNRNYIVSENYAIKWAHAETNSIFVQNAARHTHGVQDPNLCLSAWRSANIINSITNISPYTIFEESCAIDWNYIYNNASRGVHAENCR